MKKRIAAIFMALLMLLVVLAPAAVQAANTSPYCRISYDSSLGCNTVKYYSYVGGVAKFDASRLVKFYDGKVLLGTSNTTLTSKYKAGSNPAWTADGSYLVWIEADNSAWAHIFGSNSNVKIGENVSSIGINADSMAETLSLNGKVISVAEAVASAQKGIVVSGNNITTKPDVPVTPTNPTVPTTTSTVKNYIDSAGYEHFQVENVDVKVNGATVYLNSYIISEMCNSGVRFLGIDSTKNVYLYEDASNSYYKFSSSNIFNPDKIQFATGCTLISVQTDKNGYLSAVVTTTGTYTVQQLVTTNADVISVTYAINKDGYSSLYTAGGKKYTATCTNGTLYLDTLKVTENITKFGFQDNMLIYVKSYISYKFDLETHKVSIWKQNVAGLIFSSENGLVTGVTRLASKKNYVANSATKAVLYQSGKSVHTIHMNSAKTKVYFDDHVIAKLSKKQIKAGKKYSYVGFTETNQVVYSIGTSKMTVYKLSISNAKKLNYVNKASKWTVSSISRDSLGFMTGK